MSPWLFDTFMDNIVRETKQRFDGGVEMKVGMIQLQLSVLSRLFQGGAAPTYCVNIPPDQCFRGCAPS